jgi:hypothetical protein
MYSTPSSCSSTSFPEDAAAVPIDQDDSQEDELINILDDTHPNDSGGYSFQEIITKKKEEAIQKWQKTLGDLHNFQGGNSSSRNEREVMKDVMKWEEKFIADVKHKSKAMKLKQLRQRAAAASSSNTTTKGGNNNGKKSLPKDVANILEEMEDQAEEEVHAIMAKEEVYNNNTSSSSEKQQREKEAKESQMKYMEMLYHLGILDKQIKDHQAGVRKCTRRVRIITMEQKSHVKAELAHHKSELAKAEREMTHIKKAVDSQLRSLFLLKLTNELAVQEESVKAKEADVRKWQIILKKAQEGIHSTTTLEKAEKEAMMSSLVAKEGGGEVHDEWTCSSSCTSSSSSSSSYSSIDSRSVSDDLDDEEEDGVDNTYWKTFTRAVFLR